MMSQKSKDDFKKKDAEYGFKNYSWYEFEDYYLDKLGFGEC
jgi:hypothetical protein